MIDSERDAVGTRGAAQATLAALEEPEAQPLVERCLAGASPLRLGVARVLAANIRNASYPARCERDLIGLFDDADPEVRKATCEVFVVLGREGFTGSNELVDAFLASQSFDADGAEALVHGLNLAEAPPPELSLHACQAHLGLDFAADRAPGGGMTLHSVGELAVRAYADAGGFDEQNAALDVIDQVLELDTFRMNRALADYER